MKGIAGGGGLDLSWGQRRTYLQAQSPKSAACCADRQQGPSRMCMSRDTIGELGESARCRRELQRSYSRSHAAVHHSFIDPREHEKPIQAFTVICPRKFVGGTL